MHASYAVGRVGPLLPAAYLTEVEPSAQASKPTPPPSDTPVSPRRQVVGTHNQPAGTDFIEELAFGFSFERIWNVGTKFARNPQEFNSYRVSNQLAFAFMWLGLPFLYFTYQDVLLSSLLLLSLPLFLLTVYINAQGRHMLARLWLVFAMLGVLVPMLAFSDASPVPEYRIAAQVILLAAVSVPLVLFELHEREPLWTLIALTVGLYFSFRWIDSKLNVGPGLPEAIYFSYPIYWLLSAEAFLMLVLSFGYFKRANARSTRALDVALARMAAREMRQEELENTLLTQTRTLKEAQDNLATARAELDTERAVLAQQKQRLRGLEENLAAREAELEAQRAEEQLIQRYDRLTRGMLADPVPQVLSRYLSALSFDFPLWQGVAWVQCESPSRLFAVAGIGISDRRIQALNQQPVPELLLHQTAKGTYLYTHDIPEGELVLKTGPMNLQARALLLLPLLAGEQLVGILELVFAEPLSHAQQTTLNKLGGALSVLLQGMMAQQKDSAFAKHFLQQLAAKNS